jgi:hypothetical protein
MSENRLIASRIARAEDELLVRETIGVTVSTNLFPVESLAAAAAHHRLKWIPAPGRQLPPKPCHGAHTGHRDAGAQGHAGGSRQATSRASGHGPEGHRAV